MHSDAEKMSLLEPSAQIWMKIDPCMQRQKCRPMTLISGNIKYMRILAGVPLDGDLKWEWGGWQLQFLAIWVATSSETSKIRPAILHRVSKKLCQCYFLNNSVKHWQPLIIFGTQHQKKLDVNDLSLVHLTLILLLHYLVKCRSRSLAVYNNEFTLGRACRLRKALWDHKIIEDLLLI